jgi:hypothetical protein
VPIPASNIRRHIYQLRGDRFEEMWGFLPAQGRRELLAAKWRRVRQQ